MVAIWDYAIRGIEAEAANEEAKQHIRGYKARLKGPSDPELIDAKGLAFTAEKMNQARRQHALAASGKRVAPTGTSREPRSTTQTTAIKRTADKYITDPERKK